jgi:hypothetical protein
MTVIDFTLVLGLIGGVLVAAGLGGRRRSTDVVAAEAGARRPLEPPTINYSQLKVSGLGGFGLVVVCIGIAIQVPQIRGRMIVALLLGVAMGALLVWRRHNHPLPSSDASLGANTTLKIDE